MHTYIQSHLYGALRRQYTSNQRRYMIMSVGLTIWKFGRFGLVYYCLTALSAQTGYIVP